MQHAPLSTTLTGGPTLQFGSVQEYLFGPHRIGLALLQLTMFLTFVFNPRDQSLPAMKKQTIIIITVTVVNYIIIRAVERLMFLIALIARLIILIAR